MKETELKPCPVCGKKIKVVRVSVGAWTWMHSRESILPKCPIASSRAYSTREELVREMNRRDTDGKAD